MIEILSIALIVYAVTVLLALVTAFGFFKSRMQFLIEPYGVVISVIMALAAFVPFVNVPYTFGMLLIGIFFGKPKS